MEMVILMVPGHRTEFLRLKSTTSILNNQKGKISQWDRCLFSLYGIPTLFCFHVRSFICFIFFLSGHVSCSPIPRFLQKLVSSNIVCFSVLYGRSGGWSLVYVHFCCGGSMITGQALGETERTMRFSITEIVG